MYDINVYELNMTLCWVCNDVVKLNAAYICRLLLAMLHYRTEPFVAFVNNININM